MDVLESKEQLIQEPTDMLHCELLLYVLNELAHVCVQQFKHDI